MIAERRKKISVSAEKDVAEVDERIRYAKAGASLVGTDAWTVIDAFLDGDESACFQTLLRGDRMTEYDLGWVRGRLAVLRELRDLPKLKAAHLQRLERAAVALRARLERLQNRTVEGSAYAALIEKHRKRLEIPDEQARRFRLARKLGRGPLRLPEGAVAPDAGQPSEHEARR